MPKQSQVDQVIKEMQAEIEMHQQMIAAAEKLMARLRPHSPSAKPRKPRIVKQKAEDKTA